LAGFLSSVDRLVTAAPALSLDDKLQEIDSQLESFRKFASNIGQLLALAKSGLAQESKKSGL
jgi:hypothetical protein